MIDGLRGACALTIIVFGLAACSDGTAARPGRFSAARVEAGVAALEHAAASPVLGSLEAVARAAGTAGATSATVGAADGDGGLEDAVRRLATVTSTGAALIPVMSPSVLGQTFVYDASTGTYVPDATRTGAPPNGVRFVLYEIGASGDLIPGNEIGYADLTDEQLASPTAAGIRLVVVTGGVTRLSYAIDLTGSAEAASLAVQGFLSDGTERVDFSITASSQAFSDAGPATLDATVTVPQHGFTVTAKATGTAGETSGDGQIDMTIKSGPDVIVVDAATVEGQLDAKVTVNGQLLATATGDPNAPVIRGEAGRELTAEEMHALGAIVGLAQGFFAFVAGLLVPAGVLLLIAIGVGG